MIKHISFTMREVQTSKRKRTRLRRLDYPGIADGRKRLLFLCQLALHLVLALAHLQQTRHPAIFQISNSRWQLF